MSMNPARLAVIGVALIAGIAAFFLIMNNKPQQAEPVRIVEKVKEESVNVLVSTRDVTRGGRFTVEDFRWVPWPLQALQPNFITDETPERRDELVGAVARSLIVTNEPIVAAKVVKPGEGLMSALLAPGMRALTVRVSPESSSGGFILPGDRVDIHAAEQIDGGGINLVKLFENVRILAVNTIVSENPDAANIPGNNVTVELSPEDAEIFMTARSANGNLQLTLRSIFEPEGEVVSNKRDNTAVTVIRYGRS